MKRKTSLCVMMIAAMTASLLSGCGSAAPSREADSATAEVEQISTEESVRDEDGVIRLTMMFVDPATSPYAEGGQKIADLVAEATDGRILIEVIADSEYGERELVEMAMDNRLDIATAANSVLTNYIPQMNILDQAYLWTSAEQAHAAVDGRLGDLVAEQALKLGLHVIGFEESGFRNTFSVKPIETMDDFQGVTIRTMENKYHQAAFEAFGASPIALAYTDVFPKLSAGEIDACENATANCLNSGYYQITKHITNTQHAFVYIVLCMSDDAWNRIPEELREPFMAAVQEGVEWERARLVEANEDAAAKLTERGVTFHDIDVGALQAVYREIATEKGFEFDPEWQAAIDEAIASATPEE